MIHKLNKIDCLFVATQTKLHRRIFRRNSSPSKSKRTLRMCRIATHTKQEQNSPKAHNIEQIACVKDQTVFGL